MLSAICACLVALVMDACFGEPKRAHPLTVFGAFAMKMEARLNVAGRGGVGAGALAVAITVAPPVLLAAWLVKALPDWLGWWLGVVGLYLAVGLRSLGEHARAVVRPLVAGDLVRARAQVARIVSRDTDQLSEEGVAAAATESVLENGADAVFASLFWFLLAGLPGVIAHRLVNTLDAMWGYRNDRYLHFGRVAARLDDLMNWVPARLTALAYVLAAAPGQRAVAWRCWQTQGSRWKSPNAGPVMAAGAGALGVQLGGPASYHGVLGERPVLGTGRAPDALSPVRALRLIRRGLLVWLAGVLLIGVLL